MEDLALLDRLLESEPGYSRQIIDDANAHDFASSYNLIDNDNMYIKIDDDVVSIPSTMACKLHNFSPAG